MSLPKPTTQSSIDCTCLSPRVGEVTLDVSRLHVSTAVLTPWHGEASPISSSSACSTPLEKQPGDIVALGAHPGVLAVADGGESLNVPDADVEQGQEDNHPGTLARLGSVDGFYESQSGEEDDEVDEWYQPKGGPSTPTPHKPSGKPATASAVGKPPRN